MAIAGDGAHSAHPWARRIETIETPWRSRSRCLSRDGLSSCRERHGVSIVSIRRAHGALGVDAYRAMGYLPAAMRNYLVRLGWSHGDQEIFSTEEMIMAFDLSGVGRSAARFDFAKLESLNGHYIRHSDDQSLVSMFEDVLDYVPGGADLKRKLNDTTRAQLMRAMPSLKERAKT